MKKIVLAALSVALLSAPAVAQDKKGEPEPEVKITQAQITGAINTINAFAKDKAKLKSYCQLLDLGAQADDALEKKDEKKAEELSKKADAIADSFGDKFNEAMGIVGQVNPDDKASEKLYNAVDSLESNCTPPEKKK